MDGHVCVCPEPKESTVFAEPENGCFKNDGVVGFSVLTLGLRILKSTPMYVSLALRLLYNFKRTMQGDGNKNESALSSLKKTFKKTKKEKNKKKPLHVG